MVETVVERKAEQMAYKKVVERVLLTVYDLVDSSELISEKKKGN